MTSPEFFLYSFCTDLTEMQRFYSELMGLEELAGPDETDGVLAYTHGDVQFTLFSTSEDGSESITDGWHRQPGWSGGEIEGTSWSFQLGSEADFSSAVDRLLAADIHRYHDVPQWVGYWSFPVKDPAGNTVEITYSPPEQPSETDWDSG